MLKARGVFHVISSYHCATRIAHRMEARMRYVLWLLLLFVPSSLASQSAAVSVTPSPHAINIPKWFSLSFLDFQEDVAEAAREGRRLMVYVGQDGCPYCTALMKVNFGDAAITAYTRRHFVAVALNLWGDREVKWIDGSIMSEKALAAKLRVQYTPTLLFFDESARVVLRLNATRRPTNSGRRLISWSAATKPSNRLPTMSRARRRPPPGRRWARSCFSRAARRIWRASSPTRRNRWCWCSSSARVESAMRSIETRFHYRKYVHKWLASTPCSLTRAAHARSSV